MFFKLWMKETSSFCWVKKKVQTDLKNSLMLEFNETHCAKQNK